MKSIILTFILFIPLLAIGQHQPEFSTAGFYELANSGRRVYSMNPAWRFYKGGVTNGESLTLDDASWDIISLPHGIELLSEEASGCVN